MNYLLRSNWALCLKIIGVIGPMVSKALDILQIQVYLIKPALRRGKTGPSH
jgi:hypothetical protein